MIADVVGEIGVTAITVQVDTPDANALNLAETSLRSLPGVRSADTTSLALGGLSVIRVAFAGNIDLLKTALTARGWSVEAGADTLRIHRTPTPVPAAP